MADAILEKAIAKRDAAQRALNKWTTFIEAYRELIDNSLDVAVIRVPHHGQSAARPRPVRGDPPPGSELAKTVEVTDAALNDAGRPLPLDALFNEVSRRGFVVTGAKPKDNYSARLYNSGRYRSLGKKTGWWFRDRPLPGAAEPPIANNPTPEAGPSGGSTAGGQTVLAPMSKLNGGVSAVALLSGGAAVMSP